jgi:hypothetical protein
MKTNILKQTSRIKDYTCKSKDNTQREKLHLEKKKIFETFLLMLINYNFDENE